MKIQALLTAIAMTLKTLAAAALLLLRIFFQNCSTPTAEAPA